MWRKSPPLQPMVDNALTCDVTDYRPRHREGRLGVVPIGGTCAATFSLALRKHMEIQVSDRNVIIGIPLNLF